MNWFSGLRTATLLGSMDPPSRDVLLVTPIGELADWWIGVRCTDRCNRPAYLPLRLMAARHGGRLLLRSVLQRLRCQVCATPPGKVWLTDHPIDDAAYGGVHATWSVPLAPAGEREQRS